MQGMFEIDAKSGGANVSGDNFSPQPLQYKNIQFARCCTKLFSLSRRAVLVGSVRTDRVRKLRFVFGEERRTIFRLRTSRRVWLKGQRDKTFRGSRNTIIYRRRFSTLFLSRDSRFILFKYVTFLITIIVYINVIIYEWWSEGVVTKIKSQN